MEAITHADAAASVAALADSPEESALLLHGEHGIGKSHLLSTVHAQTGTPSVLVRLHRAESHIPLAGFASLLGALRHEPAAEFHRYFSLRSDDPDGLYAAAHDLLALIGGLQLPPTVALVDDVDHMDPESLTVLGTMASHLVGTSLWIVATSAEGLDLPGFTTKRLARLTTDELVTVTTGTSAADEQTVRILAAYAGGNPRILAEQVARLDQDQADGTASLALPPRPTSTSHEVTASRLEALAPTTREVLELVAIAPMTHVAVLTSVFPEGTDEIDDLIDAGVLRRRGPFVTLTDQRLRTRLYWEQDSRSRREHHSRLAEAYGPHDERLAAWHRAAVLRGPQSVDLLLRAATSLVDDGRVGAAVELIERALGRAERVEDHAETLLRLCRHLMRGGHLGLADRYSARARPDSSVPTQALDIRNLRLMAQMLHNAPVVDDELLTLADLHTAAHPEGVVLMLIVAATHHTERWEVQEGRRLTDRAMALLDVVSEATRAKLLAVQDILDGLDGRVLDDRASQRVTDPLALDPDVLLLRGRACTVHERYQDARQLFTVVVNHPDSRRGLRRDLATYAQVRNEIGAGEFRMARSAVDRLEASTSAVTVGTSGSLLTQAWYAYSLGAADAAEELIERALVHASVEASQAVRSRALALRGTLRLLAGESDAAVMELRQVSAASARFRSPTLLRHWADYTEACVMTGRVQEAGATVMALERRLATHRSRWGELALRRCRALVANGAESLALFDAAAKEFGRDELPYELGRTLRCLALRQEELGHATEARRTRMAAVTAFEAAGADAWVAETGRAGPSAAASPGQAAMLDRLTPDEREVALRVVQGLRNREIAQALFVSVRTVELRLTHIYRTLGVHSRAQLIAAVSGATVPDPGSDGGRPNA